MPFKNILTTETLNQLYRYALSLARDEAQGYDLVQGCVEKFLQMQVSSLDKLDSPVAYMKRMIRHAFFDQQRRKRFELVQTSKAIAEHDALGSLAEPTLEDIYMQQQEVEHLLGRMSAEEGELLYLWAVEEFTFDEISEIKGIARGTLLSRMHRLKKRVQRELTPNTKALRESQQ